MSLDAYHHIATKPAAGQPLVFTFHGTGGDENQFAGLIRQILPDAGLVSPRGNISEYGANRFFRRKAEGVYDMDDLAAQTIKMTDFIAAHTYGTTVWLLSRITSNRRHSRLGLSL